MKRIFPLLVICAALVGVLLVVRGAKHPPSIAPVTDVAQPPSTDKTPATAMKPLPPQTPVLSDKNALGAMHPTGKPLVSLGWGGGAGQVGRKRQPESAPEAPMAIAAGPRGALALLDQVNGRIDVFRGGRLDHTVPIGSETDQDLAFSPSGKLAVLDRLGDKHVRVFDESGKLLNEVPLQGKGVADAGGVTGVFATDDGIWVESEHGASVRIADANGTPDADRPSLAGRPTRDGKRVLAARIADRAEGVVALTATDRASGAEVFDVVVPLGEPLLHIVALDSDARGNVFVAGEVGRTAATPPYAVSDEALVIARVGPDGGALGVMAVPPLDPSVESFRPVAIEDDGTIDVMRPGEGGVTVTQYRF